MEKKEIEIYANNKNNCEHVEYNLNHTDTTTSSNTISDGSGDKSSSSSKVSSINTAAISEELEALSIFMTAPEPRAVLSAEEPYLFLYCNDRFLEVFHQTGIMEGAYISTSPTETTATTTGTTGSSSSRRSLFNGFIRSKDNYLQRTGEVLDFLQV